MFCTEILTPFIEQCKARGHHVAFDLDGDTVSYYQLAEHIAHHVTLLQAVEEPYVGMYVDETIHGYAAIWATWFCGKTAVPISINNTINRNELIQRDCSPMWLYTPSEHALQAFKHDDEAVEFLRKIVALTIIEHDYLIVLYTSGSTGVPKGTPLTRSNIVYFMRAFNKLEFDWHTGDRCMQMFDLSFDFSMLVYLPSWLRGASIFGIPRGGHLTPYVYYLLTEKQLTILPIVPTILNYLKPYFNELDCSALRQIMLGGEALPVMLVKAWYEEVPFGTIYNVYGPTECTMLSTCKPIARNSSISESGALWSIGYLFDGMLGMVLTDANTVAKTDEPGELCLAGPQLTPGYLNRPELNEERFFYYEFNGQVHRFYKTGDWVIQRPDGSFDFIGRIDNQVKLQGGFRVELDDIEGVVSDIQPDIRCVMSVIKNAASNNHLVAVFESAPFDIALVKAGIRERLPWYMEPAHYFFMDTFPINQNKKTNRLAIQQWAQTQYDTL